MSSFLVENSTISKLADALRYKSYEFSGAYNLTSRLAQDLYDLNIRALRERYDDPTDLIDNFVFTSERWELNDKKDLAQFYKSLACFIYQCSEGEVPETELYKMLEEAQDKLAYKIAMDRADEQGAEWC